MLWNKNGKGKAHAKKKYFVCVPIACCLLACCILYCLCCCVDLLFLRYERLLRLLCLLSHLVVVENLLPNLGGLMSQRHDTLPENNREGKKNKERKKEVKQYAVKHNKKNKQLNEQRA